MTYFLDSNIVSYILNGKVAVKNRIEELLLQGALIKDADLFIGCSALENNAILVTNNVNHLKRIPGLKIEVLE